jgi:hypothetical protein
MNGIPSAPVLTLLAGGGLVGGVLSGLDFVSLIELTID